MSYMQRQILAELQKQTTLLKEILVSTDNYGADVTTLTAVLTDLQTDYSTLVTALTAIQSELAAGGSIDTSALDALVTQAQGIATSIDGAVSTATGLANPPAPSS